METNSQGIREFLSEVFVRSKNGFSFGVSGDTEAERPTTLPNPSE